MMLLLGLTLVLGAFIGLALSVLLQPRSWHPVIRRLRRRLLGSSWEPVLLSPYEPPKPAPQTRKSTADSTPLP